jgi:hypothetical protein
VPLDIKQLKLKQLMLDATPLASFLIDLPAGARQRLRTAQPGFPKAMGEIVTHQDTLGERAGITAHDFQELLTAHERIEQIDALLPSALKLVEVLEESRAVLDDKRQRYVSAFAKSVEMRAKALGDEELLAKYEQTRLYRSSIARKAVRTRQRNQEALAKAPEAPEAPIATLPE